MAQWDVVVGKIEEILDHPGADRLDIVYWGGTQLVVRKGDYHTGDIGVVAPEKSILPPSVREYYKDKNGDSLLKEGCIVKPHKMRGERSEGVLLPESWLDTALPGWRDIPVGTSVAEQLGITKQESTSLVEGGSEYYWDGNPIKHDVDSIAAVRRHFNIGDDVIITEKIHGSQIVMYWDGSSTRITTKGRSEKNIWLHAEGSGIYGRALENSGIEAVLAEYFAGKEVLLFGEVVPCQKGFSYGKTDPVILLYRVRINGVEVLYNHPELEPFSPIWVPVMYSGPLDSALVDELAKGREGVSGKELHIKEGVVISKLEHGRYVSFKKLNPKYEGEDDIN